MESYDLWLFLHVTAVVVWVGGAIVLQVVSVLTNRAGSGAERGARPRRVLDRHSSLPPVLLVVGATGLLLRADGGWDWSEPFIWLGLVLWAGISVAAFGYVSRELGATGRRIAAEGPQPELLARVGTLILFARVLIALLLVVIFLMTVKPGT